MAWGHFLLWEGCRRTKERLGQSVGIPGQEGPPYSLSFFALLHLTSAPAFGVTGDETLTGAVSMES